jgi:hypothetical protein
MQDTKSAEQCQHMKEAGQRSHMRGRHGPPRVMMLIMPVMMMVPLCMQAAQWRSLQRIERKLDDLDRRTAAVSTDERA